MPGKIVLRIFPDALSWLRLPEKIIAVTGSNGKTTTTELIVHALEATGMKVGWNREGSNQTEGVATLLLRIASFSGDVKRDAIVMECDERYAKKIFEKVRPSILLVTNLCRDQLTRNGHPEFIEDCLRAAIDVLDGKTGDGSLSYSTKLVLNADDAYVAALATSEMLAKGDVLWFGINPENMASSRIGMYDDGAFCPRCKARMTYDYHIAGHYGKYNCAVCGLKREEAQVEAAVCQGDHLKISDTLSVAVTNAPISLAEESSSLTETLRDSLARQQKSCQRFSSDPPDTFDNDAKMNMAFPSVTGAYNFCAAVAVAEAVGISVSDSVHALDKYELTSGRVTKLSMEADDSLLSVDLREGLLLLSKHENSFAYDRSLTWIAEQKKPCTVVVVVDAISRKYYTSETSWLWDIDFDLLADDNVKNVVLAGRYVNELAARFALSQVDRTKISYVADLKNLRKHVQKNTEGEIYAVTCFSDKAKVLKAFEHKNRLEKTIEFIFELFDLT